MMAQRVLSIVLCGALAGVMVRDACAADEDIKATFRQYERDIPALYLLNGLNLSRAQVKDLVPVVAEAGEAEEGLNRVISKAERQTEHDAAKVAEEMAKQAARGKSAEEARAGRRGALKSLREAQREVAQTRREYGTEMDGLCRQASDVLTDSQKDIMGRFKPCFIPARDFKEPERIGQASEDYSHVERALTRLRAAPEHALPAARSRAVEHLTRYTMKANHVEYSAEREAAIRAGLETRLDSVLQQLRETSDADFELEKGDLARTVAADHADATGAESPAAQRHKIRAYLLNPGNLGVLEARARGMEWTGKKKRKSSGTKARKLERAGPVRAALRIADLTLTEDQAADLLGIVREVNARRADIEAAEAQAMERGLSSYATLKRELAAGSPSASAEGAASRVHGGVKTLREEDLREALLKGEEQIDGILSVDQLAYLTAKPKPGDRPDAGKVRENRRKAEALLEKVRRMRTVDFEKSADAMSREFVQGFSGGSDGDDGAPDPEAEAARVKHELELAREMSSSAFSRQKEELAADLCPTRAGPRDPTYGRKYKQGEPMEMPTSVSSVFFNETAESILARISGGRATQRSNRE